MREIILSKGDIALVDDEDFDYISTFTWYLSGGYAQNEYRVFMHRLILNAKSGEQVDHKDHIKLNNQKYNIRIASISENAINRIKREGTNSRFKGVKPTPSGTWASMFTMLKRRYRLGHYKSEIAAAYAYNKKAKELSEFALLNELNYSLEELENMLISDRSAPKPKAHKQSNIKHIYWHSSNNRWVVHIKNKHFGSFIELSDAIEYLNVPRGAVSP